MHDKNICFKSKKENINRNYFILVLVYQKLNGYNYNIILVLYNIRKGFNYYCVQPQRLGDVQLVAFKVCE